MCIKNLPAADCDDSIVPRSGLKCDIHSVYLVLVSSQQTDYLSIQERDEGLKNYKKHSFWNGLGINFLNTSIISLLAISFGATNFQIGYISSVFHFAGIILIFLPRLLNGAPIKKVFFYGWLIRGLVCYLYGLLFFMEGQAAVAWIMILYTLFAVGRSVGVPMAQPMQRKLVKKAEEGSIVVKLQLNLTLSQLISQITSVILLSIQYFSGIVGLILLTFVGATNNTVASAYINRIPSREKIEYRKGKNIFVLLRATLHHKTRGRIFLVRIFNLANGILLTFAVAFLRRAVGMPDNMVFIYSISGALAAIVATRILRPFVDKIGSKSLLVIASLLLSILSVAWAVVGVSLPWVIYYVLGFFTMFFMRVRLLLLSRLLIKTLPSRDTISYTAMLNFVSAIAGITVGLVGGALADFSASRAFGSLHTYSFTYFLAATLSFTSFLLSFKIRDPGGLTIRETAAVFFSVKNIKAYLDIYQLDTTTDPQKRETSLRSLEQSDSPAATEQMRSQLNSPLYWEKERALRSLYSFPRHEKEIIEDIISEARDQFSYNRKDAIIALGAYPARKARRALHQCLDDEDPEVVAAALKSLARVDDYDHIDHAYELLRDPNVGGRAEIEALRALSLMDDEGRYLEHIFTIAPSSRGTRFQQLAFVLCARSLALEPPLSDFYLAENEDPGSGFQNLMDETREVAHFHDDGARLITQYKDGNLDEIWTRFRQILESYQSNGKLLFIKKAIIQGPPAVDTSNTLAATYFTYHILKD